MFTKLRDKLKESLKIFSKITEEEVKKETPEIKTSKKEEKNKKLFLKKITQIITTRTISEEKFDQLFWNLEVVLLENNVSLAVIEKIKENLKKELVNRPLPRNIHQKIKETLKETLKEILSIEPVNLLARIKQKEEKPFVLAFFGVNGSGKTTTLAKLSYLFQKNGLKTVLAASDTFRAAAIQQLEEHASNLNTKIIKHDYGADAAAVAFDAIKYARKNNLDVVLIDTAGRLHSNINLMEELKKIIRVTRPDFKIFVGEAITGNDCIEQAQRFNQAVNIDGVILTKADLDEKGGAFLSVIYVLKKPILYLGTGQEYSHLQEFKVTDILEKLGLFNPPLV